MFSLSASLSFWFDRILTSFLSLLQSLSNHFSVACGLVAFIFVVFKCDNVAETSNILVSLSTARFVPLTLSVSLSVSVSVSVSVCVCVCVHILSAHAQIFLLFLHRVPQRVSSYYHSNHMTHSSSSFLQVIKHLKFHFLC